MLVLLIVYLFSESSSGYSRFSATSFSTINDREEVYGTVLFDGDTFSVCSAFENGGAIYFESGYLCVYKCNFDNCIRREGGGIYAFPGVDDKLDLIGSNFTNCSSETNGGAVSFYEGILHFYDNCVKNAQASQSQCGGGLFVWGYSSKSEIDNNYFYGCSAKYGGAVYISEISFTLRASYCTFKNCSAQSGGAVYIDGQTPGSYINFVHDAFVSNLASDTHGGHDIYFVSSYTPSPNHSEFEESYTGATECPVVCSGECRTDPPPGPVGTKDLLSL